MKPLLAHTIEEKDWDKIKFPILATPKLDGIRSLVIDSVVYSRSMKPIRSKAVQELFGKQEYNGFDGELIYGIPTAENVFRNSTSFCMSEYVPEGMDKKNIIFYVFDKFDIEHEYSIRINNILKPYNEQVKVLKPHLVLTRNSLLEYEELCLNTGYEGTMVRDPHGRYKQGRSTLKEGILGKIKRFSDAEGVVIGFEEKMHNANVATINELGYTERSSSKDGLVGANTLGSLLVRDAVSSVEFSIGTGFDDKLRSEIWENKEKWLGKIVKYKSFKIGEKDKPRFPVMLELVGIRHEDDM